jgi:ribosomal protein S18 acetylase RimI-like enzyme
MTAHPLDRPVWTALCTRQRDVAVGGERALRYHPEISPFVATRDDGPESMQALAELVAEQGSLILFRGDDGPLPPRTLAAPSAMGVQMVAQALIPLEPTGEIAPLGEADAPAMLALATLTKPGPFLTRTHQLGDFWGVKENGRLVAMAGERMKVEGFTEVSGVCTHPDFRGRGYGGLLLRTVATRIADRGETPFLHAYASNTTAIKLYKSMGFALRRSLSVTVLSRQG